MGTERKILKLPANMEHLEEVLSMIRTMLEDADAGMKSSLAVEVVVEEIVTNIASYAYPDEEGKMEIDCLLEPSLSTIVIHFTDWGIAYNPIERENPDINAPLEERGIGGLGIYMTKKMMDQVTYERIDGKNRLTIQKNIME